MRYASLRSTPIQRLAARQCKRFARERPSPLPRARFAFASQRRGMSGNLRKWQVRQVGLALRGLLAKIEGNQRARDFIGEDMMKEAHEAFGSLSVSDKDAPPIVRFHDELDANRKMLSSVVSSIMWLADPAPWKE